MRLDITENYTTSPNEYADNWQPHLSTTDNSVMTVVIRNTAGYHTDTSPLSVSFIQQGANMSYGGVRKSIKRLCDLGLISKSVRSNKIGGVKISYITLCIGVIQCGSHPDSKGRNEKIVPIATYQKPEQKQAVVGLTTPLNSDSNPLTQLPPTPSLSVGVHQKRGSDNLVSTTPKMALQPMKQGYSVPHENHPTPSLSDYNKERKERKERGSTVEKTHEFPYPKNRDNEHTDPELQAIQNGIVNINSGSESAYHDIPKTPVPIIDKIVEKVSERNPFRKKLNRVIPAEEQVFGDYVRDYELMKMFAENPAWQDNTKNHMTPDNIMREFCGDIEPGYRKDGRNDCIDVLRGIQTEYGRMGSNREAAYQIYVSCKNVIESYGK